MSSPASAVTATSVPRARTDVAAVTVDGEAVIHAEGRVHVLDPVATLVWHCCDGEASVEQIGRELATAFGASAETVSRDVANAIGQLGALGLLVDVGEEPAGDAAPLGEEGVLLDPPGACAACGERTWKMRRTYRVGRHLAVVGTDSDIADRVMAAALSTHLVDASATDGGEPPFFAMEIHDGDASGGVQPLHLLHRGAAITARSRRPDRILRALLGQVASYGDVGALGLGVVNAVVVGRDDRAVLVPQPADPTRFRHALARLDLRVADLPVALVDPSTGDVVVGAPGLTVDLAPIDALTEAPSDQEPQPLPWGRYQVIAVAVAGTPDPSTALLTFAPEAGDHRDHSGALRALVALLESVPVTDAVDPDALGVLFEPT